MNRQQAIELARKIRDIRAMRIQREDGQLSYHTLLRLKEMDYPRRYEIMWQLVSEGYAESVEAIEQMMNTKAVMGNAEGTAYCPAHRMSDDL